MRRALIALPVSPTGGAADEEEVMVWSVNSVNAYVGGAQSARLSAQLW
jgi:hypothetical protein